MHCLRCGWPKDDDDIFCFDCRMRSRDLRKASEAKQEAYKKTLTREQLHMHLLYEQYSISEHERMKLKMESKMLERLLTRNEDNFSGFIF